jgi:hypothetical protein
MRESDPAEVLPSVPIIDRADAKVNLKLIGEPQHPLTVVDFSRNVSPHPEERTSHQG